MTSPKTHAERMAELLAIYDEHKSAGLIQAIDYADSIAAQLEAERSVNAFALKEQTSGIENERDLWWAYRDATEQLRAAEGVVEAARVVSSATERGGNPTLEAGRLLAEALSAFDAINPDGSKGGAGEGVG